LIVAPINLPLEQREQYFPDLVESCTTPPKFWWARLTTGKDRGRLALMIYPNLFGPHFPTFLRWNAATPEIRMSQSPIVGDNSLSMNE
jgi:hypothetical protein